MHALYLASVFLHLVAAAAWVGGMLALAAAVVPVLRRHRDRRAAVELLHESGLRLRALAWIALGLLLATGVFQLLWRLGGAGPLLEARFWATPWGRVLAVKLCLVAAILGLAAVHDFRIGPRATRLAQGETADPAALRLRRTASWIGRVNLALSLAVLALGVLLVRG